MGAVLTDPIARLIYMLRYDGVKESIIEDALEDIEENDGLLCQHNNLAQYAEDCQTRINRVYDKDKEN